jgi:hypothetical protein
VDLGRDGTRAQKATLAVDDSVRRHRSRPGALAVLQLLCCNAGTQTDPEDSMNKLLLTAALCPLFAVGAQAQTAQQSKMTTCNKEAGDNKGDARKKFMSDCLKK